MKKVFLILAIFTSIIACKKDDGTKALTPKEQSVVDQDKIMEYMKTNKFEDFHVGVLPRHIDWKIVPLDDDDENTETLFNLMGENIIESNFNGVDYKMYYYIIDKGAGGEGSSPKSDDRIYVDYNAFSLYKHEMGDRLDKTEFNIRNFEMNKFLYEGWNLGFPKFNSGITDGLTVEEYRKETITPGRGILIMPSGLSNNSGVLRFDIVLYHNEEVEVEE